MLRTNFQTTCLLIKEQFNRALLDTLDHDASHNVIEEKCVFVFHKSLVETMPDFA